MDVVDTIYKVIDEKCLKQSAVARAAGYEPKVFNAMLRGRKRETYGPLYDRDPGEEPGIQHEV